MHATRLPHRIRSVDLDAFELQYTFLPSPIFLRSESEGS